MPNLDVYNAHPFGLIYPPPRPPTPLVSRVMGRLLALTLAALACLGLLLNLSAALGLLCSITLSDATLILQFIAFVPRWIWIVVMAAGLAVYAGSRYALVRRERAVPRTLATPGFRQSLHALIRARRPAGLVMAITVAMTLYVVAIDIRPQNLLKQLRPSQASGAPFVVLHWNLTMPDCEKWEGNFRDYSGTTDTSLPTGDAPLLYVLTTNQHNPSFERSVAKLRASEPQRNWNVRRQGSFTVLSALPIKSFAVRTLPNVAAVPGTLADRQRWEVWYNAAADKLGVRRRVFPAQSTAAVMQVVLDGEEGKRDLVVWLIDLPSDPLISRRTVGRNAAEWLLALRRIGELSLPDVVIGDCNMPRSCRSLSMVMTAAGTADHPLENAFEQAGVGIAASWPIGLPLLHIDHTFVGPHLRTLRYELLTMPVADHYAQRVVLQPASP